MKDKKHIRRDFHSVTLVMPQGVIFFIKHGHVAYQIDEDDEQNKMPINFHPRVKLVTLGRGQKVKHH